MSDPSWPDLDWNVSSQRLDWWAERTKLLAVRARAFELALEQAQAAGEAPLSKAAEELAEWEHVAATVFMYVGLGEAKQLAPGDVPVHAEELAKVYANLRECRSGLLQKLGGDAAAKVRAREDAVRVDAQQLQDRVGELPAFSPELDALGAVVAQLPPPGSEQARPVTGDELRQRMHQENKPVPEPPDFRNLLGALPPPWVMAVFHTLGLEIPPELLPRRDGEEDDDGEEVELTVNSRSTLQRRLLVERVTPELLQQIVFALEEEDRALLAELVREDGALDYAAARAKFGKDDADGFFWLERPASGPLARVRRTGLGFVHVRGGRQVLVMPREFVPTVRALLEQATAATS